jgi:probable lipoprotein NlpC
MSPIRLYFIILVLILTGCTQSQVSVEPSALPVRKDGINQSVPVLLSVQNKLIAQYHSWKGTPHRWGGMSKQGIDCSGLVQLTFQQKFALILPRTTAEQVKMGQRIRRSELRPGDLVFFKTGMNVRHVGMMVDSMKFLHASSSRGVLLSRMDNLYWQSHYWQSRRIEI